MRWWKKGGKIATATRMKNENIRDKCRLNELLMLSLSYCEPEHV